MKIKEVESITGLSKPNIRFYESEALLTPQRGENGYREYSPEDVRRLKQIVVLRKLGMSVPDIRELLTEKLSLAEALARTEQQLAAQREELDSAAALLHTMSEELQRGELRSTEDYFALICEQESRGGQFHSIGEDFIALEKEMFLHMWGSVFLFDMRRRVKKHGWRYGLLLALGICTLRGVLGCIGNRRSFFEGFSYPLFLMVGISLIVLPLFLLQRKFGTAEAEEESDGTWKTALLHAVLYLAILIAVPWGSTALLERVILPRLIGAAPYYVANLWGNGALVYGGLSFFTVCIWCSRLGIYGHRFRKTVKRRIIAGAAALYLLCGLISCGCFDVMTERTFSRCILFHKKSYTLTDVNYCTMSCEDEIAVFSVAMRDGTKMKATGGFGASAFVDDRDYVRQLAAALREAGVPLIVDNWEDLEKHTLDYWLSLVRDVKEIYSIPETA